MRPGHARTSDPAPWDPGLQNERTGLAWQRTMLSGLGASLLVARLLAGVSPVLAIVVGTLALGATAALGAVAVSRFRRHARDLPAGLFVGDGRPQAITAALLALTALGALGYVLLP